MLGPYYGHIYIYIGITSFYLFIKLKKYRLIECIDGELIGLWEGGGL